MLTTTATAGTIDITPGAPVPLAGSEIRTGVYRGIADGLEANALVLRQAEQTVVLVTFDLVFVGQELRDGILRRLGAAVTDDSLFLAASHTHFAPATDGRRPRLGRLAPAYVEEVADRVAGLIARLLETPGTPVSIGYHRGRADHAINRRLRVLWHLSRRGPRVGAVVAAPNPHGPRDETIHLLRVSDPAGRTVAVVWSYACHPVAFPRTLEVSADYPGRVRRQLRGRVGENLPVLFWQGFAGDIRPREIDRSTSFRSRARRLLLGPRFGRFTQAEWEDWAESLAERVVGVTLQPAARELSGRIHARRVTRPLDEFVLGAPIDRQVTFHGVTLGDDVAVVGISAEAVAEYGALLNTRFEGWLTIPVGYIDDVYGYLPTGRMLEEGGYEVSWFLQPFALRGPVHPEIERHCLAALRELEGALAASSTALRE